MRAWQRIASIGIDMDTSTTFDTIPLNPGTTNSDQETRLPPKKTKKFLGNLLVI